MEDVFFNLENTETCKNNDLLQSKQTIVWMKSLLQNNFIPQFFFFFFLHFNIQWFYILQHVTKNVFSPSQFFSLHKAPASATELCSEPWGAGPTSTQHAHCFNNQCKSSGDQRQKMLMAHIKPSACCSGSDPLESLFVQWLWLSAWEMAPSAGQMISLRAVIFMTLIIIAVQC